MYTNLLIRLINELWVSFGCSIIILDDVALSCHHHSETAHSRGISACTDRVRLPRIAAQAGDNGDADCWRDCSLINQWTHAYIRTNINHQYL